MVLELTKNTGNDVLICWYLMVCHLSYGKPFFFWHWYNFCSGIGSGVNNFNNFSQRFVWLSQNVRYSYFWSLNKSINVLWFPVIFVCMYLEMYSGWWFADEAITSDFVGNCISKSENIFKIWNLNIWDLQNFSRTHWVLLFEIWIFTSSDNPDKLYIPKRITIL